MFYAWGEPVYIILMLFSTLTDYFLGRYVERFKERNQIGQAKLMMILSVIINLSLLGFFKYGDFIIYNISSIFEISYRGMKLPLPIGISFYTFQTMSYTIDIYRGEAEAQSNIIDFGVYVSLFPQLIAGPIVRYKTIARQLKERQETIKSFSYGAKRFLFGLGKKVLFANNIGLIWEEVYKARSSELSVLSAWIGITAFALQIYYDFSGYSDMAIGLGSMFGFRFLENFNYPYMSKSITEFWRRWHISLGSWFKEYVYIPFGGNRKGPLKHIRNITAVWLLTGIWHGASWNFVLWGGYFALLLIAEKLILSKLLKKLPAIINHLYALIFILFSWVIFAFESVEGGIQYFKAMFGITSSGIIDNQGIYLLYTNIILFLILFIGSTDYPSRAANKVFTKYFKGNLMPAAIECTVLIIIFTLSIAYLVDGSYNPFLYFRF